MSMLSSGLQSFLSNDSMSNESIDYNNVSDETLMSAKDKLYELMERMKEITNQISSPITIQQLKDKIAAQINKITLIEKYLVTKKKSNKSGQYSNIKRDYPDNNFENIYDSNVKYKPLYNPDETESSDSNLSYMEDNDGYHNMHRRSSSFTTIVKSIGNTTWSVWNRVKIIS